MFNPPTYQCKECESVLRSKWSGHFSMCECRKSFVDFTEHYGRWGGNAVHLTTLLKEDFARLYFSELLQEFLDENSNLE